MERVVITDGSRTATLSAAHRFGGTDLYAGESFTISIKDDGLQVERTVFVYSHDWIAFAAFFQDPADSWRGWDGTKTWESIEHDLTIEARSDAGRHCLLSFTVRNGPMRTWTAQIDGISIDAGEDLASLARAVRSWVGV